MPPTDSPRLSALLAHLHTDGGQTVGSFGGYQLGSHFQPIFSLSHARVVGHEALLRARDADNLPVPPPAVFKACRTPQELAYCDSLSRLVHMHNFAAKVPAAQWLFLNVHPDVFQLLTQRSDQGDNYLRAILSHLGLEGRTLVLEVLETAQPDMSALEAAMHTVREHGCLVAIDDFGAGHSNFDRVWRLQPDIVKIDRSLVVRAARDRQAQRVVSQMISLLHECGSLVLLEGVETLDEALLAIDCDADMVQGYYFGRPQPQLCLPGHSQEVITQLYGGLGQRREHLRAEHRQRLSDYRDAIGHAGVLLSAGQLPEVACHAFLMQAAADICYVLDQNGYQIGTDLWGVQSHHPAHPAYEPLQQSDGACWARRPYFRRAIDAPGKVQITRPYRTLHGKHLCVTVAYAYTHEENGERSLRVICGDLTWSDPAATAQATP